jgi:hypothetical protein
LLLLDFAARVFPFFRERDGEGRNFIRCGHFAPFRVISLSFNMKIISAVFFDDFFVFLMQYFSSTPRTIKGQTSLSALRYSLKLDPLHRDSIRERFIMLDKQHRGLVL